MFINQEAQVFVPDGIVVPEALSRTTMMGISAHQDDLEFMAYDGILKCFGRNDRWFTGVVVTNGAGSPRNGPYENYSDAEMQKIRQTEQKKAAYVGEYAAQILLNYSSATVKDPNNQTVVTELRQLLWATKPQIVYTHNLADKHETHVATVLKVIQAIRELPEPERPEKLYGCEVWRDLDWLPDAAKVVFDLSARENLAMALMGVFDSQIAGGKRYDLAIAGRRRANATFSATHAVDTATGLGYAMDLTPLVREVNLDLQEYVLEYIDSFKREVAAKIKMLAGK
jgi:LmbE family N-acetylglucosaminyl deacetylase